jgi:hypothetical protein
MSTHKPRVTIVSSSDETYAPLLEDLIASIRAHRALDWIDVSVVSHGMTAETEARVRGTVENFAQGRWNIEQAGKRAGDRDWLMGRVVKLFMSDYFPDYDIYIWIDADAWVSDPWAVEWLIKGAQRSGLAIAYDENALSPIPVKLAWLPFGLALARTYCMKHLRRAGMPQSLIRDLALCKPFNNGVFALTKDAPHWAAIQANMARLVRKGRIVGNNQVAIIMAVHADGLPVSILPHAANYLDIPMVDAKTGAFVEAILPHHPVSIMHLAARDEMRADATVEMDMLDTEGNTVRRSLRYRPEYLAKG